MEVVREQGSECSSGCESGWTTYLDQSDGRQQCTPFEKSCWWREGEGGGGGGGGDDGDEEEEENLSMVSDASSGPPPHLQEESSFCYFCCCHHHQCGESVSCFCSVSSPSHKRRRVEPIRHQKQQDRRGSDPLDDTASSHLSSFSERNVDKIGGSGLCVGDVLETSYSLSATHFKGKSSVKNYTDNYKPTSAKLASLIFVPHFIGTYKMLCPTLAEANLCSSHQQKWKGGGERNGNQR